MSQSVISPTLTAWTSSLIGPRWVGPAMPIGGARTPLGCVSVAVLISVLYCEVFAQWCWHFLWS